MCRKLVFRLLIILFVIGLKPLVAQTDTEFWTVVPEINNVHHSTVPSDEWKGAPGIFRFTTFSLASTVTLSLPADPTFTPVVLNIPANTTMSYEFWRSTFPTAGFDHDDYCAAIGATGSSCDDPTLTQWCSDLDKVENFLEFDNISKKGVLIEATNEITCYFEIGARYNRDIISLKGKNALGTDFYVPFQTYFDNRDNGDYRDSLIYSAIQIVATEEGITNVHIVPTKDMYIVGSSVQLAGVQYDVQLNQGEVFIAVPHDPAAPAARPHDVSVHAADKLAGSRVWTNGKKIAVLTTDDLNNSTIGNPDYMADQIVPNNILGNEYIAMRGKTGVPGADQEIAWVLATKNNTPIYIDDVQVTTLNAGEQYRCDIVNKTVHIATFKYGDPIPDLPICVYHTTANPRQLAAAILPPIDKCTGSFEVALNRSDDAVFYLLVMVRKGAAGGFTLNGVAPPAGFTGFTDVSINTDWQSAMIDASSFINVNEPVVLANSIDMFHVAIINGNLDNFYGYFSDFNVSAAEAISADSRGNLDGGCEGDVIQLQASGGVAYAWESLTDNSFSDPNISNPTVSPVIGNHKYDVVVDQTCFPNDTLTVWVAMKPRTVANFNVDKTVCCSPEAVSFVNVSENAESYVWDFNGDLYYDSVPNDTILQNNTMVPIVHTIGLTAQSENCPDYIEKDIRVNPIVVAKAKLNTKNGCAEVIDAEFDVIGAGGSFTRVHWDWGDGTADDYPRPPDPIDNARYYHSYTNTTNKDTTYYAVATFFDDVNFCDSVADPIPIFVPGVAKARFTVSNESGCSPLSVNFDNTSWGNVNYTWNFGNGTVSTTGADTLITFVNDANTLPETYTVNLQVELVKSDGSGSCFHDTTKVITVYPEFTTEIFPAGPIVGCNPLTVDFSQTTTPNVLNLDYDWTFGDGTNSGAGDPAAKVYSHTMATDQNYQVNLTTTSEYNCVAIAAPVDVTAYAYVDAKFSVLPDTSGCSPLSITIENISSSNSVQNFTWTIADTMTISDPPVDNAPFTLWYENITGTTQVRSISLSNDNAHGCPVVFSKEITVFPEITSQFTKSNGSDTICHNTAVSFTNSSVFSGVLSAINSATPNASFYWEFGDGTTSAEENPVKTYQNSTGSLKEFEVKLTLTVNGCTSVFTDYVRVHSEIKAQLNTDNINVCAPNTITLNNTTIGGATFTWSFSDGTAPVVRNDKSSIDYAVDNSDANSVINSVVYLTATAATCSHSDSLKLNVYPHIIPVISPDDWKLDTILTPASECIHSSTEAIGLKLLNNSENTYAIGYKIPVELSLNDSIFKDTISLTEAATPNNYYTYSLTSTVNLVEVGSYNLSAKLAPINDIDTTNNSYEKTIETYPTYYVDLGQDSIITKQADSILLDASDKFAVYTWNVGGSQSTYAINNLESKLYKVTVTDEHNCATSSDSVQILASDLTISEIKAPRSACTLENATQISFVLKNEGNDILTAGTGMSVYYKLDNGSWMEKPFTLPYDLSPGKTKIITVNENITLESDQTYDFTLAINYSQDFYPENDTINTTIFEFNKPTINLGDDIYTLKPDTVVLRAQEGFANYQWQDLSKETSFNVIDSASATYHCLVNNAYGCIGADTVEIYSYDLVINSINKLNSCTTTGNIVTANIAVNSYDTLLINDTLTASYTVQSNTVTETITLTDSLHPGKPYAYTFATPFTVSDTGNYIITCSVAIANEVDNSNNSTDTSFRIGAYPVKLGEDIITSESSAILDAGEGFASYLWSNSTNLQTLTVNSSGKYKVTTTDINGCTASDSINVLFLVGVYEIKEILGLSDACEHSSSEALSFVLQNAGNDTIKADSSITISFKVDTQEANTENYIFTNAFIPGSIDTIAFANGANISTIGADTVLVSISVNGKVSNNDTIINTWPTPIIDLGADIETPADSVILNAGDGLASYTWNTTETTQSIVVKSNGDYSVTVSNSNGCTNGDTINIFFIPASLYISDFSHPLKGCGALINENIQMVVTNGGQKDIPAGTQLTLGYQINNETRVNEVNDLPGGFGVGKNLNYEFTTPLNYNGSGEQTLRLFVRIDTEDMDTLTETIPIYAEPVFFEGNDTIQVNNFPYELDSNVDADNYLWNNNETTKTISIDDAGEYWVQITTSDDCQFTDSVIVLHITGIHDAWSKLIKVYPNPGEKEIWIELPENAKDISLQVTDLNGKVILNNEHVSENVKLNISEWEQGMYVLRIFNDKKFGTYQIIKK